MVYSRLTGISLVAAFILSACSAALPNVAPSPLSASPTSLNQGSPNTEIAINTPVATATSAPAATATSTPVAAATPSIADTATAASPLTAKVIPTLNAYCRKGPGTSYDQITFLLKGTAYNVIGRDGLNSWWQIQAPGNVICWVGDANVTRQGPLEQVSIAKAPSLPGTPEQFVNSFVCDITLKTLGVSFNWAAVENATGYRIYRNGSQLVEVGSTVTNYHDDAPLGVDLVYELEAFNDYGVAARISTRVPACK